ncbi:MbcA/ParS/Xre antitoxin family protein [Erythrobacter donghaensis]|uniref:MbcA/ParS/Xre antitoxin family protein n=1 Tax=Erythrobacter donghaensis TaxID=267135 RepID=UPI001FE42202|nr:MbcA/ParS/Xre antitoxin family protein [Erythrobacter donghaensis]
MLTLVERPNVAAPPNGGYSPPQVEAMQRAIIQLFDRWGVSDAQAAILMGGISTKTFRRWKGGQYGNPGRDLADRMSLLLGIHKALRIIYSDAVRGYRWISAPNDLFDGQSALDIMMRGGIEDIRRIRTYLDSVRGGW